MTKDEKAIIWLKEFCPLDYRTRISLLRKAGSPETLFEDFEKFSENVLKAAGNGLYNSDLPAREKEVEEFIAALERKNRFAVTLVSEDYPEDLHKAFEPPLVLYGEGNRSLLGKPKLCVVGSRLTPPWAEKTGTRMAQELTQEFVIVTGLAEGGDSAAIAGALPSGKLISVLPCGLDDCYPESQRSVKNRVREKGLLLSEYPFHGRVQKGAFHARNRILAGLSKGVLVISAGKKSGALMTANYALNCGREVFALPYNLGVKQGEGCNELIKCGAALATETDDIFVSYGKHLNKKTQVELFGGEERVMEALRESGELHAAIIAQKAGMPAHEAAAILSALELKGLVTKAGGNKYSAL